MVYARGFQWDMVAAVARVVDDDVLRGAVRSGGEISYSFHRAMTVYLSNRRYEHYAKF